LRTKGVTFKIKAVKQIFDPLPYYVVGKEMEKKQTKHHK